MGCRLLALWFGELAVTVDDSMGVVGPETVVGSNTLCFVGSADALKDALPVHVDFCGPKITFWVPPPKMVFGAGQKAGYGSRSLGWLWLRQFVARASVCIPSFPGTWTQFTILSAVIWPVGAWGQADLFSRPSFSQRVCLAGWPESSEASFFCYMDGMELNC